MTLSTIAVVKLQSPISLHSNVTCCRFDDKKYKDCFECHITPDWLLVYKIKDNELVLLLFATGTHSDLF